MVMPYTLRGLGFEAHWPFDSGLEEKDSILYVKKFQIGGRSSFKTLLAWGSERQHRSCQRRVGHAMGRSRRTMVPAPRAAARSRWLQVTSSSPRIRRAPLLTTAAPAVTLLLLLLLQLLTKACQPAAPGQFVATSRDVSSLCNTGNGHGADKFCAGARS